MSEFTGILKEFHNNFLWYEIYSINPWFKIIIDTYQGLSCLSYRILDIHESYIFSWEDIYRINPMFNIVISVALLMYWIPINIWSEVDDITIRPAKRFYQRGTRGWADEDVWSFDSYLSIVIYGGLTRLKETQCGYAMTHNPQTGEYEDNEERWKEVLDKMIYAYKLNKEIADDERSHYASGLPEEVRKEHKCLTQKEEMDRRIGMFLMVNYFNQLWD